MNKTLVVLIFGMLISAAALAESGMYVALDVGQSTFKDACTAVPATVSCKNTNTTMRIATGYNFSQAWLGITPGIEVGYVDLGRAAYGGSSLGTPVSGGFHAQALIIEGTGALAISENFSIIAKLGFDKAYSKIDAGVRGFGTAGTSSTKNNAACAIGFQYAVSRKVGIRAQYENLRTFGNSSIAGESNVRQISAGLVYSL